MEGGRGQQGDAQIRRISKLKMILVIKTLKVMGSLASITVIPSALR